MPVPIRFTADTLNTYDDEAVSPVTVMEVDADTACMNVVHEFADARRYCTT
jgi:hypothetical protein